MTLWPNMAKYGQITTKYGKITTKMGQNPNVCMHRAVGTLRGHTSAPVGTCQRWWSRATEHAPVMAAAGECQTGHQARLRIAARTATPFTRFWSKMW